jgi:glycine/D-amino acid oxidase-like deaminating enzyme
MKGAGRPIWDDLASRDDLATLEPDAPETIPSSPDVLVVGGGAIGLSIAVSCTRAGMDVVLVEREARLAGGPSGRAAGGLSPDVHPELGPQWRALARRSLELHRELDAELGYGLRATDLLVMPELVIPDQAHVDPLRFCAALARRAGTVVAGADADDLDIAPTHVVYATGGAPETANVAALSYVKGHLVATEPMPPLIDGIVVSVPDDLLGVQLPSGHIVCGGTKEPHVEVADVDDAVVSQICETLSVMCGRSPRITHSWTCFRPLIGEGLPAIVRTGDNGWCAAGFYSTGILMAPVVGDVIARAIAGEDLPALFASGGSSGA